jgi:exonuclease VII small subunit
MSQINNTTTEADQILDLDQKMHRLTEIKNLLEERKVTLSQSLPLLEEAYKLKNEIELELKKFENQVIELTKESSDD